MPEQIYYRYLYEKMSFGLVSKELDLNLAPRLLDTCSAYQARTKALTEDVKRYSRN